MLLAIWGLTGLAGLLRPASVTFVARVLFPLGALCGVALAIVSAASITAVPERVTLAIGLPDLPMHLRRDSLSSAFLFLLGAAAAGISTFAAGYFRRGQGTPPGLLCLQYHLFLCAMGFVLLADDAYAFMVSWETMALASYFLVIAQHGIPEIRRAGFLYLLIAHVGAISILLAFGVMQGGSWQFTFDAMREARLAPPWAAAAFLLAILGFGAKAGLVPLHVWLPEAHPAAPSPVSALMSGVMLKTAVYGFLRVAYDLLPVQIWWWGVLVLAIGLATALFGVVLAAVQSDMKRLLAFSSLTGRRMDVELARHVLRDVFPRGESPQVTIERIQRLVCEHFTVTIEELTGHRRSQAIVYPRQVAMYLARELTDASLPKIGREFGNRDHTTVMHATSKITRLIREDRSVYNLVQDLTARIKQAR